MSDTEDWMFRLTWLHGDTLVLLAFYAMSLAFLVALVRGLWQRQGPGPVVLGAGALFLLLPSWAVFAVAAYEVVGPQHSYYVAAMLIYGWIGVAINMLSTLLAAIALVRARARDVLAGASPP